MAKESLSKITSGIPRPKIPAGLDPEMDNYLRNLDDYLRRLTGSFTPINMPDVASGGLEELNWWFKTDPDLLSGTLPLVEYAEYACTLDRVSFISSITVADEMYILIDGTDAASTDSRSLSTSQKTVTFTGDNTVSIGSRVEVEIRGSLTLKPWVGLTVKRTRT